MVVEPNQPLNVQPQQEPLKDFQNKTLFDENFMKIFMFSPALTLNKADQSSTGSCSNLASLNLDEQLIPVEKLMSMFKAQDQAGISPTLPVSASNGKKKTRQGSGKQGNGEDGKSEKTGMARYRKRVLTPPPKAQFDPTEKAKLKDGNGEPQTNEGNIGKAKAGADQPRHSS